LNAVEARMMSQGNWKMKADNDLDEAITRIEDDIHEAVKKGEYGVRLFVEIHQHWIKNNNTQKLEAYFESKGFKVDSNEYSGAQWIGVRW